MNTQHNEMKLTIVTKMTIYLKSYFAYSTLKVIAAGRVSFPGVHVSDMINGIGYYILFPCRVPLTRGPPTIALCLTTYY